MIIYDNKYKGDYSKMSEYTLDYYNLLGTNEKNDDYCIINVIDKTVITPNDELFSKINYSLVNLYFLFQKKIFPAGDYFNNLSSSPIWLGEAGIGTELITSKKIFEKLLIENNNEIYNKILLVKDIEALITGIQDRIFETKYIFIAFYKEFNHLICDFPIDKSDSTYFLSDIVTNSIFSLLENFFVKLYSIFDLFAKLYFEKTVIYNDFSKWPHMKSKGILFGDKNKFDKTIIKNTIFDVNDDIKLLINLRNNIIHDGTFMYQNRIYFSYKENKLVEKYILMMDHYNGIIDKVGNRNRFYNNDLKLNYYLPVFYIRIIERIYNTIRIF